jgi:hypothetical protein
VGIKRTFRKPKQTFLKFMSEYIVALKIDRTPHTKKNRNCTIKNFLFHLFEREDPFFNVFTENQVKLD